MNHKLHETREKTPAANSQFGASGGVVSCDTLQEFGSLPPVQSLPLPSPVANLLKRTTIDTLQKVKYKKVI